MSDIENSRNAFSMIDIPLSIPVYSHTLLSSHTGFDLPHELIHISHNNNTQVIQPAYSFEATPIAPNVSIKDGTHSSTISSLSTISPHHLISSTLFVLPNDHIKVRDSSTEESCSISLIPKEFPKENRASQSITFARSPSRSTNQTIVPMNEILTDPRNMDCGDVEFSDSRTEKDLTSSEVGRSSTVVVAPSMATPSLSLISASPQSISFVVPSMKSSSPTDSVEVIGAHLVDERDHHRQQQARDVLEKGQLVKKSKSLPPLIQKDNAAFSVAFTQSRQAIAKDQQQEEIAPPMILDTTCHCLVMEESLIPVEMKVKVEKLLALTTQSSIETFGKNLLNGHISSIDISSIYIVRESKTIHINFVSITALGAALVNLPFLVRCGSTPQSRWNYTKPCGPTRDNLPELIRFSYTCPSVPNVEATSKDMEVKLKQLGIAYTFMDLRSQPMDEIRRNNRSSSHRVSGSLLPRDITSAHMITIIDQLHGSSAVGGHTIRAHGPNQALTNRCNQCERIGHYSKDCQRYEGIAIRLCFKDPIPYKLLCDLITTTSARDGFLGSSIDERRPSRRVTFLFDSEKAEENRGPRINVIGVAMSLCFPSIQSLLAPHAPEPKVINVKDRTTECRECGSTLSAHECPFSSTFHRSVANTLGLSGSNSNSNSNIDNSIDNSRGSQQQPSLDKICHSWRSKKICPRLQKGQRCTWNHPPSHVPDDTCHQFRVVGRCRRGDTCRFGHPSSQPQPGPPAAVVPPILPVVSVVASVIAAATSLPAITSASPTASLSASPAASPSRAGSSRKRPAVSKSTVTADLQEAKTNTSIDIITPSVSSSVTTTTAAISPPRESKKARTESGSVFKEGLAGLPHSPNSWALLEESDEEEEKSVLPPQTPTAAARTPIRALSNSSSITAAPISSLGSLFSPRTAINRTPSGSPIKKGTGIKYATSINRTQ